MNPQDLSNITVYDDFLTVLKERGYTDEEAGEMFVQLATQAEMEVTEELLSKLTDEQLALLDSMPDDAPSNEIAEKLGLDGEIVDKLRAEKTAKILSDMAPVIDSGDDQVETS